MSALDRIGRVGGRLWGRPGAASTGAVVVGLGAAALSVAWSSSWVWAAAAVLLAVGVIASRRRSVPLAASVAAGGLVLGIDGGRGVLVLAGWLGLAVGALAVRTRADLHALPGASPSRASRLRSGLITMTLPLVVAVAALLYFLLQDSDADRGGTSSGGGGGGGTVDDSSGGGAVTSTDDGAGGGLIDLLPPDEPRDWLVVILVLVAVAALGWVLGTGGRVVSDARARIDRRRWRRLAHRLDRLGAAHRAPRAPWEPPLAYSRRLVGETALTDHRVVGVGELLTRRRHGPDGVDADECVEALRALRRIERDRRSG